jgi:hypothetical protein
MDHAISVSDLQHPATIYHTHRSDQYLPSLKYSTAAEGGGAFLADLRTVREETARLLAKKSTLLR